MRHPTALSALLLAILLPHAMPAQAPPAPVSIVSGSPAEPGGASLRRLVRDTTGNLYAVSIIDDGMGNHPVQIHVSGDGGQTWALYLAQVNDATSGLTGTQYANRATIAIDSQNRLHVEWLRAWYPSYFQTYYRWIDLQNGINGPILDLTSYLGVSTSSRTGSLGIVVDPQDHIWLAAPSSTNWRAQILRSNVAGAVDNQFTSVGIPSSSGSCQTPRMCVDILGNIHTTYYQNTSGAPQVHRMYDVAAQAWSAETILGDNSLPHDYRGQLVSDHLGNVHALVIKDSGSGGSSTGFSPEYIYRRWDAATGWGPIVTILDVITPSWSAGTYQTAGIGCDEFTGTVFVAYRDFNQGGELRLAVKTLQDTGFRLMADLAGPSMTANDYVRPGFRGSLYPLTNNCAGLLDITWRQGGSAPYDLMMTSRDGVNLASVSYTGNGCTTASGVATLTAAPPAIGAQSPGLELSGGDPGGLGYVFAALSLAASAIQVAPGCRIRLDPLSAATFISAGISPLGPVTLDASGAGVIPFPVPWLPGIAGIPFHLQGFMTSTLPPGFALTQAATLTLGF